MASIAISAPTERQTYAGVPVLGSTFEWLKNPRDFTLRLFEKHGPVTNVNYFFKDVVFLLGAEANERVLMSRDQEFSSEKGWTQVSRLFSGGLMLLDFEKHLSNRRVIQRAFTHKNLSNYLKSLRAIMKSHVSRLTGPLDMKAYDDIKVIMLQTAAATFLGIKNEEECVRMNAALIDMLKAASAVMQLNIPGTDFGRGMKAREYLKNHLGEQVELRRATGGDDLFTQLCVESLAEDSSLSNEDVVEHMIFLVMAAHDTTASTLSSITMELAQNPEWQEAVRNELAALPDDFDISDFDDVPITEAVINEALRLHPPIPDIPRKTTKEVDVLGHKLPKGTRVVISPNFTHHYAGYWKSPFKFDPDRFLNGKRSKDAKFHWLPFGNGVHKCIGLHFAYLETKLFLRTLLNSFNLQATGDGSVTWNHLPFPHPKESVRIVPRHGAI